MVATGATFDKSSVAAIVLAAGSSRRFGGGSKLLAEIEGRPLLAWTAAAFVASRVGDVIVVTGPEPKAVEAALDHLPVRFVGNPDYMSGMGGSIAVGIASLGADCHGVLICPGDMPGITAGLVDSLIATFDAGGGDRIVRPVLPDGRHGHPVLWPRRHFSRLAQLRGPGGGKGLLGEFAREVAYLRWPDAGAVLDIDTAEDLERFRLANRDAHGS